MTRTTTERVADATSDGLCGRSGGAKALATELPGALAAGGRAYVDGVAALGRTLGAFGREVLTEAGQHVRATFGARSVREIGELQTRWAQHRIETAATHANAVVDLVRARSEAVLAPVAALFKQDKAA
jgi:hypothetical protein